MDKSNGCGGVKVTYIETQFVTSDAAGFKDLVQRLTGRAVVAPAQAAAAPPHRPRPCRATAVTQGCGYYTTPSAGSHGRAPPCQMEEFNDMADLSDLFYFGGSESRRGPHNGGYNDFPY
ncbi:hypothetical protein PR202_gb06764 [Eleusine coracana subsp. coracana]|uniref:VQ domain-containing protein n=1 Tax=Eleusine coracana subsp. coracana TaxID=191504 RepID=A0AAV5E7Z3_ELECO|nr:hypothetical protein QOZ80_2BG0161690 [Eleusine coracana subsp. coracana]GJN19483.1 hypothetical protein PR202_gb06764 [Eleusine coracana subsp. coracana]